MTAHADLDAYFRAANYLTVAQIYLQENPLLREPLLPEHIKPRLLGHWGTSPGLNLLWAHLNRAIVRDDLNVLFMAGPGHGGPAVVANAYLEGTYSEIYPHISRDEAGRFIAAYFRRYEGVRHFMEKTLDAARAGEAVQSVLGRRRLVADIKSGNRARRLAAERIAMNMPTGEPMTMSTAALISV